MIYQVVNILYNFRINSNKTTTSKYIQYNRRIIGSTPNNDNRLDVEVVVPLKYLIKFLRSLNLPLINCTVKQNLICYGQDIV